MYREISLADAVEFVVDNRGKSVPVQETGFPLIATNCVSNKRLYPEFINVRFVSDEIYENWFRSHPLPNDILLTNKGSQNGAVCLVPDPVSFCIAQDMVALRAKKGLIRPEYLFAALRSTTVQARIKNLNVDAVIPHFKKTDFDKLYLPLPDDQVQKSIGGFYLSISQKIEINHQINQTLEQMAQAIFKSWFVDFEPVKAKIASLETGGSSADAERAAMQAISGKDVDQLAQMAAEQPEHYAELQTTAALFPAAMQDSELGEIPEGWEVRYLKDVTKIAYGKNLPTKKLITEGFPVFGGNGVIGYYSEYLYEQPQVLIACRGAASGKVVRSLPNSFVTNNSLVIESEDGPLNFYYLDQALRVQDLTELTSGSAQPQMTIANMNPVQILVPGATMLQMYLDSVMPMYSAVLENNRQSKNLYNLRDALLPKLLSGELTLPEAEAELQDVANV